MSYKQSPFPTIKGTSQHKSALKQIAPTTKFYDPTSDKKLIDPSSFIPDPSLGPQPLDFEGLTDAVTNIAGAAKAGVQKVGDIRSDIKGYKGYKKEMGDAGTDALSKKEWKKLNKENLTLPSQQRKAKRKKTKDKKKKE